MLLSQALRLSSPFDTHQEKIIAFTGAGGKTTALFQLARELPPPIVVTTTTHLGVWQVPFADHHILAQRIRDIDAHEFEGVTLVTDSIQGDRVPGVQEDVLSWLCAQAQMDKITLLIEADGSRQKAVKAPAEHEPAIPGLADVVIVAAGLGALGMSLNEDNVHRPQLFSTLSDLPLNESITSEALLRVLTDSNGGLKNIPPHARRIIFLNQADTPDLQSVGGKMSQTLLEHFESVIVGSLRHSWFQTFEKTAGIILAAGASTRFGQPKQLLDWRGEPFVRVVAETALKAGLSPVVAVVGANSDQVEARLKDLPIIIVRNESWQSGQASSIRAGLKALPPSVPESSPKSFALRRQWEGAGSAIFLLSDQPQITGDIIQALIEHHTAELYPIIAPLVRMEQRANPVLFDRLTFPDLLKLAGDIGGRAIFPKFPVEYLPWHDDKLLLDVDRPEDYQRLVEDDTL